jgi:hypothetical protein
MPLEQWDRDVGLHLRYIVAGTEMIASHVNQIPFRPEFETMAEDQMEFIERLLENKLECVRRARAEFRSKKLEA